MAYQRAVIEGRIANRGVRPASNVSCALFGNFQFETNLPSRANFRIARRPTIDGHGTSNVVRVRKARDSYFGG